MTNNVKSPLLDIFESTLKDAMRLKKAMLKNNVTKARSKCPAPNCGGMLHGVTYKGRSPTGVCIRMYCDGPCKRSMIE